VQVLLLEVVCDTSFLINLATKRVTNLATIGDEIGSIKFVVPETVIEELKRLQEKDSKSDDATHTLNFIRDEKLKIVPISGKYPDEAILQNVKQKKKGLVATMDRELKKKIKRYGGSVVSFSKNKIVLES